MAGCVMGWCFGWTSAVASTNTRHRYDTPDAMCNCTTVMHQMHCFARHGDRLNNILMVSLIVASGIALIDVGNGAEASPIASNLHMCMVLMMFSTLAELACAPTAWLMLPAYDTAKFSMYLVGLLYVVLEHNMFRTGVDVNAAVEH